MTIKKWDAENITNQEGRIGIVTGSSSGIGFEAARVLAGKGATVIIAVRNLEKGNAAVEKIKGEYKDAHLEILELDLALGECPSGFVGHRTSLARNTAVGVEHEGKLLLRVSFLVNIGRFTTQLPVINFRHIL